MSTTKKNIKKQPKIYTPDDLKNLVCKIEMLNDKIAYMKIHEIMIKDKSIKYTRTDNAMYIDMTKLTNETLIKIDNFLEKNKKTEDVINTNYVPYVDENQSFNVPGSKLTNHEKIMIKRKENNNFINNNEFQPLDVGNLTSDNTDDEKKKKHISDVETEINNKYNSVLARKVKISSAKNTCDSSDSDSYNTNIDHNSDDEIILNKPKTKSNRGRKPKSSSINY
jgi:hypothetical protein